jgi:cytochrome c-type biogenesis protein CcmH/NrfG
MDFLGGRMKFKMIYLYASLILLIVVALLIMTTSDKTASTPGTEDIKDKEMPSDEVHKGLIDPGSPNKGNVTSTVFERLEEMKKEVEKSPNDTLKLRELADFLTAAHKPDEAIPYYEKILKMDPNKKDVLFNLSFIYNNKHDFIQAEKYTNRILKLDPKDNQALYNLGAINASRGDKKKAREIWEKIVTDFSGSEIADLAKTGLSKL